MNNINKDKLIKISYWSLVVLLFFAQYIFTTNSLNQIRYEELAESIRNVWWLQNGNVYDGVSSNVGWYTSLLATYNVFGFSIFAAKFFRLVLHVITLFCLASILKKHLGIKFAFIPLFAIGLSPTLLFFNTLQSSFGIDLQYLPICIYLISTLNFQKALQSTFKQFLLGFLAMVAWMSYPTFIFYLPILAIVYLRQLNSNTRLVLKVKNSFIVIASFVLPLCIAILTIKNKQLLFYDERLKSGIFRGAGNFAFDVGKFFANIERTLSDLLLKPNSYYYEIAHGDFSMIIPAISLILILTISVYLITRNKSLRLILLLSLTLLLSNLIISGFTSDPSNQPGIRRYTPSLVAIYIMFTSIWYWVSTQKNNRYKNCLIVIFLFVPLHHLIAYPLNLSNLKNPSPYQYSHIFGQFGTPDKSLETYVKIISTQDLKLVCSNLDGKPAQCRYVEAYSAIAGYCFWNKLNCRNILGYDDKTQQYIPLTTKLWQDYYWEH